MGDLLGSCETAHRDLGAHLFGSGFLRDALLGSLVAHDGIQALGAGGAGEHVVHGDSMLAQLIGEGLGPIGHRRANGVAHSQVVQRLFHAGADDVDDAAKATLFHAGNQGKRNGLVGDEVLAELDVTPVVDVMLVLLIIFMITTPMMNHKVKVDLPTKTVLKLEEEKATPMTLAIDDAGQMYLDDALIDQRALEDRLRREALRTPQPMIELRADRTTQYKQIAEAMATVKNAGIRKLGFITEPSK